MGKRTDAPAPPDYEAAAERTAEGNLDYLNQQTRANRPTQNTPFGSVSWEEGGDGNWTQNISLAPEQQQALDAQLGVQLGRSQLAGSMIDRVGGEFSQPMDWSQFQEYAGPVSGGAEARQAAEDAFYERGASRLDPMFAERTEDTDVMLRNRGLMPGTEAYDREFARLGRDRTDAYQRLIEGSILAGGAEASREQGMDLNAANYKANLRNAQIGDEMRRRGFSLNEINALLSGQQIGLPQQPDFSAAGRGTGPDYTGAARDTYSANLDEFNAQNAFWNQLMGAAGDATTAMIRRGT